MSASRTTRLRLRQPSLQPRHQRLSLRPQPSLLRPRLPRQRPLRPDATLSFLTTASGGHLAVSAVRMFVHRLEVAFGFRSSVWLGWAKAELIAKGEPAPLAAEFDTGRFKEDRFIDELVAAGVAQW